MQAGPLGALKRRRAIEVLVALAAPTILAGCGAQEPAPGTRLAPVFTETRLVVPPRFDMVAGVPQKLVKKNFFLTQTLSDYVLALDVDVPFTDADGRWTLTADSSQIGTHAMTIIVMRAATGAIAETKRCALVVVPPLADNAPTRRM